MKYFLQFNFRCKRHWMQLSWALMLLFGFTASTSAQTATPGTNWLSLTNLVKKWEPVALPEIQRAAAEGDGSAAHYLGYCYGEGVRVTRAPNEALVWYQRALQAGYLPSADNIGFLYERGLLGSSNDLTKAVYYYTYGAERGLDQAQVNLGMLYRDGIGVPLDPKLAMHWFQLAAAHGHPTAMVEIGRLYRFGQGVETNIDEAIHWFEMAQEKNSSLALVNLGLVYQEQGQPEKAAAFYQQAAEQGSVDAMIQLYLCLWDGNGVPTDHPKAMEWLTKAGNAGSAYAQCLLGYRYETREWQGEGRDLRFTPPNWPQAFHWYRLSAEQNWPGGQYHLGMLYVRGKGVEVDELRGLELVRAAVDQGLEGAFHDLAKIYSEGIGVPRNDAERPINLLRRSKSWDELIDRYESGLRTERDLIAAAECYCEAAMSHSRYYWRYSLADKIEFRPGSPRNGGTGFQPTDERVEIQVPILFDDGSDDLRRALSLYLKSAKGSGEAALQIGNRYLLGQEAPQSMIRAWLWFTVAARNGSTQARTKLSALESHLEAPDLKTAKEQYARQIEELRRVAQAF